MWGLEQEGVWYIVGASPKPAAVKGTKVWTKHFFLPITGSLLCGKTSM